MQVKKTSCWNVETSLKSQFEFERDSEVPVPGQISGLKSCSKGTSVPVKFKRDVVSRSNLKDTFKGYFNGTRC